MPAPIYSRKLANYKFLQKRNRAYVRHKAQCAFRGEGFELTMADWEQFWPDEKRFARRGRAIEDLMMTRWDAEKSWSRENCCLITRHAHFNIIAKRKTGQPYEHFFKEAITI